MLSHKTLDKNLNKLGKQKRRYRKESVSKNERLKNERGVAKETVGRHE